jgi:IclR family KDG regulon transcriptional repressor
LREQAVVARKTKCEFKRVPALDKCFAILELLARSSEPLGISNISRQLGLNKSSVFHIAHTLADLDVLEFDRDGKLRFGIRLHLLGQLAGERAELIRTVHPYLKKATNESKFSAFLGIRYGLKAVIIDKVDAPFDMKVSSEVGMRLPLLAGAGGKALLSQLPEAELDEILAHNELKRFTPHTCIEKDRFREAVMKVREEGIAYDWEEYMEGIVALAVPLNTYRNNLQAAIWAVGLKPQATNGQLPEVTELLKGIAAELDIRFALASRSPTGATSR